jgi:hypothetical protein
MILCKPNPARGSKDYVFSGRNVPGTPRSNTVRFVDKVSSFIKDDINQCRIFVSEAASKFHEDFGFIKEENK